MNRLTNSTKSIIEGTATPIDVHKEQLIYLKLKSLEDIEEELGIDLITLFTALKYGIYKKGRNNFKGLILYSKMPMFSFYHKTIDNELIEDYGKTWALTEEELEDDR